MKKFLFALTATLLVASSLAVTGCKKEDDGVLYLYNWTYYTPDSVLQSF